MPAFLKVLAVLLLSFSAYFFWLATRIQTVPKDLIQNSGSVLKKNEDFSLLPRVTPAVSAMELHNLVGNNVKVVPDKKAFLLHFWATWCPTCVDELPDLLRFSKEHAKKLNLEIVIVSEDDNAKEVTDFLQTLELDRFSLSLKKLNETLLIDNSTNELMKAFNLQKIPETFLIDSDLKILHRFMGPQRWDSEIADEIKQKLK